MAVLGLALALPQPVQAKTFNCGAGDVPCLIDAINDANANGHTNTIRLEAGTYTLMYVDNDTDGPNGLPSITSHLTIKGAGAEATSVARASSAPPFRLMHVGTSGHLTVDGVTLTGGNAQVGLIEECLNVSNCQGGGLFNNVGAVNITRSSINGNSGGAKGGGLFNSLGVVNITRSTVSGNDVISAGGGLYTEGGVMNITGSSISGNSGGFGGGLFNSGGMVNITGSTFADNVNKTNYLGGGMLNFGTAVVTNTTFTRNIGRDGVAIANYGNESLILVNSTLADNAQGPMTSALSNKATTILVNTILARNAGPLSQDCDGPVISLGNNLIGDPTGCAIDLQPTDLTGDAGLGTFEDNGRPGNGHLPLLQTSRAIDAGNNAVCPRTDQRGHRRIGPCDIGAIAFPRDARDEQFTLDQSFTSPNNLGASINECCRFIAQTFTARRTGTLSGVTINVASTSMFPLLVAIRTVIGGVPSTTVLGETTLPSGTAPLSLLITFPQVIPVAAGFQYAIVVNYEGAPPPGPGQAQGEWSGASGDAYPDGALYASFLDGISWFGGEFDVHFETFVNPHD